MAQAAAQNQEVDAAVVVGGLGPLLPRMSMTIVVVLLLGSININFTYKGGSPMFVIKCNNNEDWQSAMFILSYYHVISTMYSDGEDPTTTYMVVENGKVDDDALTLAEMAFCGDWISDSKDYRWCCPHCENGEMKNCDTGICGHLTFVEPKRKGE